MTEFVARHIPDNKADQHAMLKAVGVDSLDALIQNVVPSSIFRSEPLDIDAFESEAAYLEHVGSLVAKNKSALVIKTPEGT